MFNIFKIFGIVGLLLITAGVIVKDKRKQDILFLFGGLFLLGYSSYIKDWIFITLQAVFVIAVIFDFVLSKKR